MLNQERICEMTRLAVFDQKEGERCKPMIQYFRKDYIAKEMLKSFLSGTMVFFICGIMVVLARFEELSEHLTTERLYQLGKNGLLCYVIGMIIYFIITYVVYYIRYTTGRQKVKEYYGHLKKVDKLYHEEERI